MSALEGAGRASGRPRFRGCDRPTIADLSLCGYLFWPDQIGMDPMTTYPNIAAWLERIAPCPATSDPKT
jgi:glutathione S-transferase